MMYIVLLKFSSNRGQAPDFLDGHKRWLQDGFDNGVFLFAGSLQPNLGGFVVTQNLGEAELEELVNKDPFVQHQVVAVEILSLSVAKADDRLGFLLG